MESTSMAQYACGVCSKSFTNSKNRSQHMSRVHVKVQHQCSGCKQFFKRKDSLKRHHCQNRCPVSKYESTSMAKYVCVICSKSFQSLRYRLLLHMRTAHVKVHHQCSGCKTIFKRKESLMRHQFKNTCPAPKYASTSKAKYLCEVCDKSFQNSRLMLQHLRRVHVQEKHQCSGCKKIYKRKDSLKRHHSQNTCPVSKYASTSMAKYVCVICSKSFKTLKYKLQHMRCVHVKKQNRFSGYGKFFKRRHSFQRHQSKDTYTYSKRASTFKAQYVCVICSKSFKNSRYMLQHRKRVHVKDQYQCSGCKNIFPRMDSLKRHKNTCPASQRGPYSMDQHRIQQQQRGVGEPMMNAGQMNEGQMSPGQIHTRQMSPGQMNAGQLNGPYTSQSILHCAQQGSLAQEPRHASNGYGTRSMNMNSYHQVPTTHTNTGSNQVPATYTNTGSNQVPVTYTNTGSNQVPVTYTNTGSHQVPTTFSNTWNTSVTWPQQSTCTTVQTNAQQNLNTNNNNNYNGYNYQHRVWQQSMQRQVNPTAAQKQRYTQPQLNANVNTMHMRGTYAQQSPRPRYNNQVVGQSTAQHSQMSTILEQDELTMDDLVKLHNKRKEYFEKFKHLDSLYERNSRYFTTFEKQKWTDCVTNKNSKGLFLKEIFTEREQLLKDLIFGKYRQEVPTVPDRNGMYQHLGNNNSSQVQGHQQPSSMQSLQTMQPSSQPPDTNKTASRSNHHGVQLSNLVNEIVGRCYDPTPQPNDMENRGTSDNTFNQGISSNNLRVNESHIAPPLYHSILSPSATSTSSEPNVVPAKPGNSVKRASTKSPILYSALSKPAPERGEHTDIHSRYTWHRPVTQQSNRTSSPPLAIPQTNTSSPVVQPTNTSTIMSSSPSVPSINTMSSSSLIIPSSNMTSSSSLKVTSSKPSNTFTSSSVVDPPNNTFTSPSSTMDIPSNTFTSLPSVMDSSNNTITSAAVMHPSSKISTSSSLIVPSVNTISSPSLILPQSNTTSPTPLEVSASKTISSSSHMVSPTDVIMSSSSTPVPFVSLSEFTQSPTHIAGGKRGLDDGLGIEDILEGSPSKKSTIEFFNPKITSTERMVSVEFDIPFADTPQNHDLNFDASLSTSADDDNCDNNILHENTQHDCSQFRNTGSSREYMPDELMTDGTSIEGNSNDTMLFDQQTKLVKQEIDDTKDADSPCPMRSSLFDVNNVHVSNNLTVDQTSPCSDEQDKDSFCSLEKQCPVSPCPTLAYGEDEQVSDNEDDSNSIRESISRRCLDDCLDSEGDLQRNATKESGALDVNQSETNGPGPKINMSEIMDDLIGYVSDDSDTEKSLTDAEESPIDTEESPINEEDSRQDVMKMCDSNKDGEQSDDSKIDNDMMAIRMNSDETGAIPDEETAEIHKEEITENPAQESSEIIDKESPENPVQESTENPDKESCGENTLNESSTNSEDTAEDDDCLFIKDIIFIETLSKSPELIELSDDEMDKDDKVTTTQEFEYDDNKEDAESNADDDDILRTADRVEAAITADIEDPEKDSAEKDSQCDSEQDDQITTTTSSPRQPSSSCDNRTPSSSHDGGTSSSEHQKPCSPPIQYNMKLYLVKDKDTDKERTISSEDYSKDIHTFLHKARLATVRTKLTSKHSNIPTVERDGKPFTLSKCLKKLFNKCDDERLSAALKRYTHTHRPHRNERRLFQTLLDDTVKDEHLGLLVSLRDFCKNITNIDKFINTVYGGVTMVRDVLIPYVYRDKTQYVPQNAIHVELFSSDENKMGYHNFCCVLKSVGLKSVVATPAEQAYFKPNLTTGPFSKLIKLKDFTNLALPKLLQKSDK